MLVANLLDLTHIGDFTGYPTTPVSPATSFLRRELFDEVQPNDCYVNTFNAMAHLGMVRNFKDGDVKYVVGVATGRAEIPVPHAWLKFCGKYYDPSWEVLQDHEDEDVRNFAATLPDFTYYAMAELDHHQLADALIANDHFPPCAVAIMKNRPTMLNKNWSK